MDVWHFVQPVWLDWERFSMASARRLLKSHILVYTGRRRQRRSEEQIILALGHNRGRQCLGMSRAWAHTQMSDPFGLQGQKVGGLSWCVPDFSAGFFLFLSLNKHTHTILYLWGFLALGILLKHLLVCHLSTNNITNKQHSMVYLTVMEITFATFLE